MIIHFAHMGIKASDYNGIVMSMANALIVNEAIDYLMRNHCAGMVESECIYLDGYVIDFGRETVLINTSLDFVTLH